MQEGVRHLVCFTFDVQDFVTISVVSLGETGEVAEEVGACMIGCEGTFAITDTAAMLSFRVESAWLHRSYRLLATSA